MEPQDQKITSNAKKKRSVFCAVFSTSYDAEKKF